MTSSPDWIKDLANNNAGKILIVAEGEDDSKMLQSLFQVIRPTWRIRFTIEYVSGKQRVYRACRDSLGHHWKGLVDCDEWGEDRVREESARTPNVEILPRFTAENFWINPDELFQLLPDHLWVTFPDAREQIKADIDLQLADWLAHGVMWRVMLRRQSGLGGLKFPNELMEQPVTDETQILTILEKWHDHLDPNTILQEYRQELASARLLSKSEQYNRIVHGKRFFRQVVTLALNKGFRTPTKTHEQWANDLNATTERLDIARIPTDLLGIVNSLLA